MKSLRIVFMGTPEFAVASLDGLVNSEHEVVAFTVHQEYLDIERFSPRGSYIDYPVVPFETLQESFPPDEYALFAPMLHLYLDVDPILI
jgi:methionyl-tRNA formyltransferase